MCVFAMCMCPVFTKQKGWDQAGSRNAEMAKRKTLLLFLLQYLTNLLENGGQFIATMSNCYTDLTSLT